MVQNVFVRILLRATVHLIIIHKNISGTTETIKSENDKCKNEILLDGFMLSVCIVYMKGGRGDSGPNDDRPS
jgi:hypothetical protein